MTGAFQIACAHLLAAPGLEPERRDRVLTVSEGRIVDESDAAGAVADGSIVLPAMFNAHDHGRGLRPAACGAADLPLELWLPGLGRIPAADLYTVHAVAFARLALSGVAGVVHMHIPAGGDPVDEARTVARAAADVGLRIAFAAPIVETNPHVLGDAAWLADHLGPHDWALASVWDRRDSGPVAEQIAAVSAIAAALDGPLVQVQFGPAGPQWVSDAGMARIAEAAGNRRIHTHLLETRRQRAWADAHFEGGVVGHLDRCGLLTDRLTVAHGVWLDGQDIARLADRGVTIAVNTSSNLRLRSGIAPVGAFLKTGVRIAIGLDGMAFDDDEDMLRELRLLLGLHASGDLDGTGGLDPTALFTAAAAHGRRVLDDGDGGLLAPGRDADILVLDRAALAPDDPGCRAETFDLLISRMRRGHVRDLYVAGRRVVADGRVTGIDLEAAERELASMTAAAPPIPDTHRQVLDRHRAGIRRYYAEGRHRHSRGT